MKKIYKLGVVALSVATALSMSLSLQAAPKHDKAVIGYLTQWEAWKGKDAGFTVAGEATHLNVNMDIYNILNFSFFGVAKDGSLHSGDLRNKNIYQEGVEQEPASLLYSDVYSSWDLHILWGELDYLHEFPGDEPWQAEQLERVKKQGFEKYGNGWKHTVSGVTGALPIPLKKENGAPGLIDLANQKGVKVMASIGGWSMSKHFPEMAKNPEMKARFLADIDKLMALGFHGIDIDWEYPGFGGMNFSGTQEDYDNFEQLMEDIRARIGKEAKLSAAFKADTKALEGFDWDRLSRSMDYFNMMTYDLNGGWSDVTGHNAPLYPYPEEEIKGLTLDNLRLWMKARGIPSKKINFGAAFYGRGVQTKVATGFLGAPTDKRMLNFSVDGPTLSSVDVENWGVFEGQPSYNYIKQQTGWTHLWDENAKVPYAIKGKYFLSYDDEKSVREKAKYILEHELGGIIVWQVHGDIECKGSFVSYGSKLKECTDLSSPLAEEIDAVFSENIAPNGAPLFTVPSTQNVQSGEVITFTVSGTDPDGDTLIFTAEGADIQDVGNGSANVIFKAPNTTTDKMEIISLTLSDGKVSVVKTVAVNIKGSGETENTAPELRVPELIKVKGGENALISVSATDKENDLLTFTVNEGQLVQTGNAAVITLPTVQAEEDKVLSLQVRVTDGSKVTSATVDVQVEGTALPVGESWDPSKIYNTGDEISHNGSKFTAKWWTQGDEPGMSDVWEEFDDGSLKDWSATKIYNTGDQAKYQGRVYSAKWWTKGDLPDAENSPWALL